MIRFATIGTNFIVDWFLGGMPLCHEMEYAAVYSRSMETGKAFGDKYGVQTIYDNLEDLAMDESIDAVYIASPTYCHFQHAMMMLNHGKHVLCEKPVASNGRELELMLQAAKENDVVFMEAMKCVFTPGYQVIMDQIHKIGTVRRATIQYCQYSSRYDNFKNGIIENAFKPELSNGAIMDIGCYCVHFLVKLFGMPESIQTDVIKLSNGCDGAGTILAHYDGMQAEVIYSKISNTQIPSQIQGEKGCMIINDVPHPREIKIIYNDGTIEEFEVERAETEVFRNNLVYEALEFQRLVLEHQVDHPHNKNSIMEMQVMDEARRQMGIYFPADKIMEV